MPVSSQEIKSGLDALSSLLSLKLINWFFVGALDILDNNGLYNSIVNSITGALGGFYTPIKYLFVKPLKYASSYAQLNYSDIMMIVLLGVMGTTYDASNPFCEWMFFYIPALLQARSLYYLTYGVFSYFNYYVINGTHGLWKEFFYSGYSVLSFIISAAYTIGPLIISTDVYYPDFF